MSGEAVRARTRRAPGTRTAQDAAENRRRIAEARTAAVRRLIEAHAEEWHQILDEENFARGITPLRRGRIVGAIPDVPAVCGERASEFSSVTCERRPGHGEQHEAKARDEGPANVTWDWPS